MTGNMYEETATWNPLGGWCGHECTFCSTHNLRKRFESCRKKYSGPYRIIESEMKRNLDTLAKGRPVFVCSQNDLFEVGVGDDMIEAILARTCRFPDNQYWFQTKSPSRYIHFMSCLPPRCALGTTIETNRSVRAFSKAPCSSARAVAIAVLGLRKFVTIEPIMDFDLDEFVGLIRMANPEWVWIGADSKGHGLPEPDKDKTLALIERLRGFTRVRIKPNLRRIIGDA